MLRAPLILIALILSTGCGGGTGGGEGAGTVPPYPGVPTDGTIRGEINFATLIKKFPQGKVNTMSWAGYWWPFSTQGTASATAKAESVGGGQGATSWENSHHGSSVPGLQSWWGHCNGWAAAAALFQEPREGASVGGQSFSVADQKALLSEIAMEVSADFFGLRNDSNNPDDPTFQDVAPNQFIAVLANIVGSGQPLIIDRFTGNQIWNQPMAGYQIAPVTRDADLGSDPSAPNVHRVMVTTRIWWVRDDVDGGHLTEPFAFQDGPSYESRTLRYEVWLDAAPQFDSSGSLASSGNLILTRRGQSTIGGAWRNGDLDLVNSYPDYMWVVHNVAPSSGFSNPNLSQNWVLTHFGKRQ